MRKDWGAAAAQTIDGFWVGAKFNAARYGAARPPGGIATDHTWITTWVTTHRAPRTQRRKWRGRPAAPPAPAAWRELIATKMQDKEGKDGACGAIDWWDRATRWAPGGAAGHAPALAASKHAVGRGSEFEKAEALVRAADAHLAARHTHARTHPPPPCVPLPLKRGQRS